MDRMQQVRTLRADTAVHYNCAQSVLVSFAKEMGLSERQAYALGAHFGSGMRHGSTCGAVSAALMVLGALGYDERQATALLRRFREKHGALECHVLLKQAHDQGVDRDDHCDDLVFDVVQDLEQVLAEHQV